MTQFDPTIDLILRFIDDLSADPDAVPPEALDEQDAAIAQELAQTYAFPAGDDVRRKRIWKRVLAETVAQRRTQTELERVTSLHTSNGSHPQEDRTMNIIQTIRPRQQDSERSMWTLAVVAAVYLLAIAAVFATGIPLLKLPDTEPATGMGALLTQGDNASPTAPPPPAALELTVTLMTATPVSIHEPTGVSATVLPITATPIPTPTPVMMAWQIVPENASQINELLRIEADLVQQVIASPDGRYLAVVAETVIALYRTDYPDAAPIVLTGHEETIVSVAYTPGGMILASLSMDGTVHLWDTRTGHLLNRLEICQSCTVESVAFTANGAVLIVTTEDGVSLWGLER